MANTLPKYTVGQIVKFCEDFKGKEINGIIVSVELDESVNNFSMYYYNIEATNKPYNDVSEGDIIEVVGILWFIMI